VCSARTHTRSQQQHRMESFVRGLYVDVCEKMRIPSLFGTGGVRCTYHSYVQQLGRCQCHRTTNVTYCRPPISGILSRPEQHMLFVRTKLLLRACTGNIFPLSACATRSMLFHATFVGCLNFGPMRKKNSDHHGRPRLCLV
jgi:hypothetical protein